MFIHTSAVQGAEITHECYSGREVMKFYESGAAFAQDIGVPVSKMEESSEAQHLASLKTAEDPDGGPYPGFLSGKLWDEASGKTGSGKKVDHNVISGADFAAQPFMSGVLTTSCGMRLDHSVPTVGYGIECSTDYWKVKNSLWRQQWHIKVRPSPVRQNSSH